MPWVMHRYCVHSDMASFQVVEPLCPGHQVPGDELAASSCMLCVSWVLMLYARAVPFTPKRVRLWRSEPTEMGSREKTVNGKQRQEHSCYAHY